MNKAALITLATMLFVVAAGAVYIFFLDESERQLRNETPAAVALLTPGEEEAYTDLSQQKVDFSETIGTVIVVSSWASWCPSCGEGIGRLDQVAGEYEGREVTFLAINRAEHKMTAERFLNTIPTPTHVSVILDASDHFFTANAGYAMPETIVYDKDGAIVSHQRGDLNTDELKNAINQALE